MPENTGIPFGGLPVEQQQQISAKCNSSACKDATTELQKVRNDLISDCGTIKRLTDSRNFWTTMAGIFYGAATAIAAFAAAISTVPPFGWVVAIIAGILAAILFAIATMFANNARNAQSDLAAANAAMASNTQKFKDLVTMVQANCDMDYCPADLTIPACP